MSATASQNQQPLELNFLGQKIYLKSQDDPELVQEVMALVSKLLQDAEGRVRGTKSPHQIALLALLDLAAEYLHAKKTVAEQQVQVKQKSDELISLLQAEIKSGAE